MLNTKCIMISAATLIVMGYASAEDLKIKAYGKQWKESLDNNQKCYTMDYSGKGYPGLCFSLIWKHINFIIRIEQIKP